MVMIDLKKQYREAKEIAKKLMATGNIKAYLKQLSMVESLQVQLITINK